MKSYKLGKISRRDFLKLSGITSLSLTLSACGLNSKMTETPTLIPTTAPSRTPSPIVGCSDLQSLVAMPEIQGKHYNATIPDTLDIQQHAELVLNTMTNCTDPSQNFAPYDNMYINRNPPVMRGTTMINGKYLEAAALLRYLTGNTTNRHVDQAWRSAYLGGFSNYPWWGVDPGRMLAFLGNSYRIEQNPCWLELSKQILNRAKLEAVCQDDYCYYPDTQGAMPTGWDATYGGWTLQGLTQLYRTTHLSDAIDLAGKIARYFKDHAMVFDNNGQFLARHPSDKGPALHFHHNGNVLEGISAYALTANDQELAAFAKSSYEWARATGSPLVGFFPEYINDWPDDRPYVDCETCCTADMIQIAMTLSEIQIGDYWDDVDRYLRNQFIEMQLLDGIWINKMVAGLPPTPLEANEDDDHVSSRIVGSFASWATSNDWYIEGQPGTTFCCIGNGARALYYAWEKMIRFENNTLTIHLLLNRASAWADVNSYIPYEGRVDVKIKVPCDLEIRIPEWVKTEEVLGSVNNESRQLTFRGRYALVDSVVSGDMVTLTFPIFERTVETVIGKVPYTLIIKGNDVVSIDPPGQWYPFYQRTKYRENQVRWVNQERFVLTN